jgi:hypothetical protein
MLHIYHFYQVLIYRYLYYCSKPAWKDGTTATVIVAINDLLYIASLGDSQVFYIFVQSTDREQKSFKKGIVRIFGILLNCCSCLSQQISFD